MVHLNLPGALAVLTALLTVAAAATASSQTEYHLKTKVISGDMTKGDLYVVGYHTGAGMSDITLTADVTYAAKGFLNETQQQFDYGTGPAWGLYLARTASYTEWLTTEIDVGYGDTGFSFDSSGGLVSSSPGWKGWIACDWWHGAPQLFWQYEYSNVNPPSSCAKVELHKHGA